MAMSEGSATRVCMDSARRIEGTLPGDGLEELAAAANELTPPMPHERKWVLRSEAGVLLDGLLTRCARGHGALDVGLSYEKARLVASHATDRNVEEVIATAEGMTCIELRRKLDADEERHMCTRRELDLRVPRSVALLLREAMAAARKAAGKWVPQGECLRMIAHHFVDTWGPALRQKRTSRNEVMARDKGYCTTPFCSKSAGHVHHIDLRSHGGSDEPSNKVAICVVHHLRGVHMGRVRVSGRAPDQLVWELGERRIRPRRKQVAVGWTPARWGADAFARW